MSTFIEFLNSGGIAMYVILSLSVVALAIIVERTIALNTLYSVNVSFFSRLLHRLRQGDVRGPQSLCVKTSHPLAKIINAVLVNAFKDKEAMESAAMIYFQKVTPRITKRTAFLSMIGSVATLIGLLGTIQGLIMSFSSLASASAAEKATILATGISTAMNTTAFGLIVAIPCMVAYSVLSTREQNIIGKYEEIVGEVIHVVEHDIKERQRTSRHDGHEEEHVLAV